MPLLSWGLRTADKQKMVAVRSSRAPPMDRWTEVLTGGAREENKSLLSQLPNPRCATNSVRVRKYQGKMRDARKRSHHQGVCATAWNGALGEASWPEIEGCLISQSAQHAQRINTPCFTLCVPPGRLRPARTLPPPDRHLLSSDCSR